MVREGESAELHPLPAWAHSTNFISVNPAQPVAPSGDVLAGVQDAISRYAWAFDDRRAELFDDVFTEDAVWEGLVMGEQRVGPFVGRENILKWLTRFWRYQKDQRRHVYMNLVVDSDDGHAVTAACYMLLYGSRDSSSVFDTAGILRTELVRTETGRLKIRRFSAGFDSPFWTIPVEEMSPKLRTIFGILDAGM